MTIIAGPAGHAMPAHQGLDAHQDSYPIAPRSWLSHVGSNTISPQMPGGRGIPAVGSTIRPLSVRAARLGADGSNRFGLLWEGDGRPGEACRRPLLRRPATVPASWVQDAPAPRDARWR